MTKETLVRTLDEMKKDTEHKKLRWQVEVQTTEYNDPATKPTAKADGRTWLVDECYTSYHCQYHDLDFCMITYENIETADEDVRTTNLVFIPPIAMRLFNLDQLAPYAIEVSASLIEKIHHLWEALLAMYKEDPSSLDLVVNEAQLEDEEDTGISE